MSTADHPPPPPPLRETPNKRGRPTKLTDKKRDELCAMIRVGCSVRGAAANLGIREQTVRYARRIDAKFNRQVQEAERQRNLLLLENVAAAGKKSWRASAWLLASLQPDVYNHRKRGQALGKKQLAELIANVVKKILPKCLDELDTDDFPTPSQSGDSLLAASLIDERLAEIEKQVGMPIDELLKVDPEERRCMEQLVSYGEIDRGAMTKIIEKLKKRLREKYGREPKSKPAAK
jgi:hypothetical protein